MNADQRDQQTRELLGQELRRQDCERIERLEAEVERIKDELTESLERSDRLVEAGDAMALMVSQWIRDGALPEGCHIAIARWRVAKEHVGGE